MDEIKKIHLEPSGVILDNSNGSNVAESDKEVIIKGVEKEQKVDGGFYQNKEGKPMIKRKRTKLAGFLLALLILVGVIALVGFFGILLPARKIYGDGMKVYTQAKLAVAAAKKQDVTKALSEIKETEKLLGTTKGDLKKLSFLKNIPFFGEYYKDAERAMNAGGYGLEAARIMAESVEPYADLLGLKGQGSFVGGSAEERIKKAVTTLDKVVPKFDEIESKLMLARSEIIQIDPNRYPKKFQGKEIRSTLISLKKAADEGLLAASEAKPLLKQLPKLMGQPDQVKYLILFQNDKELRPTGGFITGYAIFRLEKGIVHVDGSDDIYNLDDKMKVQIKAPDPILKYHINVYYWKMRDSNLSPDYYQSMQDFQKLYATTGEKNDFGGIIAVDTQFLVEIMKILGPIELGGVKYSTDIDPACNCPQVLYKLEEYADKPVGYTRKSRKDLIGVLMYALMEKALGSSPKLYWGKLFQSAIDSLAQKHILIYLKNKDAQGGIESLGFGGRIESYDGDYLHINDANLAGAKTNFFVRESVGYNVEIKGDKMIKKLTITYKNPEPWSNCDLEKGELCLNGRYRDWIRIYVPKGSKLTKMVGSQIKSANNEEFGKTYFEARVDVDPQTQRVLELEYESPLTVKDSTYKLLIQKQPGTGANEYKVIANGNTEKFGLIVDKEIKWKL